MSKLIKKISASLLIALFLFFSVSVPHVKAQQTWYNQSFGQWSNKVFDEKNPNEIFGERYTYAQVNWILNSITAVLIGSDITKCVSVGASGNMSDVGNCMKTNLSVSPEKVTGMSGGTITGLAGITNSLLNTRPASGIQYVKDTAANLHVVPQAYAQTGIGFNTLTPVQTLWRVVRNISYSLMIVAIIVIAFMIMFRVKISPQVVITVQSALPKIAVALVLITFSYAIAGFLVDLAYVIVGAFAAMIKIGGSTIVVNPGMANPPNGVNALNTIGLFEQLVSGNGLLSIVVSLTVLAILLLILGATLFFSGGVLSTIGAAITAGAGLVVGVPLLLGAVLILVLAIIVLFVLLRLFWLMAKTACLTVLLIIVGPLMILMGIFSNLGGFGTWIKSLASNLAVYPVVLIMIFLSHYFFWGWFLGGASGVAPIFPYLNTFGINWMTTGPAVVNLPGMPIGTNIIGLLLAFVILFLIPNAADIIQSLISGKPFAFGTAIGQATNPLGIRTFGAGIAKEAFGTYIGNQLYNPKEGTGLIPGAFKRFRTGKPATGAGQAGGTGEGPL